MSGEAGNRHRVFVSIGSNINPVENLSRASQVLDSLLEDYESSPVYRSPAVGLDGPDFLNSVVSGHTVSSATDFNRRLNLIETEHGRVRSAERFTSRTLDLDLLLYDNMVLDQQGLVLPRPEILDAVFVLRPLSDLAPDLVHPLTGQTYAQLLQQLYTTSPESKHLLTSVS